MKSLPGLRHALRDGAAAFLGALPLFKGKGRLTVLLDSLLTDYADPSSYITVGRLDYARAYADLRVFGDKFTFYYRRYEPEYIAALRELYTRGNFLDVGSNIGIYVVSMADVVRAGGGRIISIEPLTANITRQHANIELNGCADVVEHIDLAVGSESGTVFMTGDFASSSVNGVVASDGTVPVTVTTLDELAASGRLPDITLIKMDIEGYEPAVLRGGVELLKRDRPVVFAEFNRERMGMNGFAMADSWNLLKSLGYTGHRFVDGQFREISEPGQYENLLFLPAR